MAAAQVAKKLKDKRQQRTIEGIFKKVLCYYLKYVLFGAKYSAYLVTSGLTMS